jgi:glycosyltransferase involved in cell wall biosynthesis
MNSSSEKSKFVVAAPGRCGTDDDARALDSHSLLRFIALGTRRGTKGIPPERTRLNPAIGLVSYIGAQVLSPYQAESFRFWLHPWFDHWVKRQLREGDHIISSYSYANACFKWVRAHGGKTFLDGGNSHPENFWNILVEEGRRWNWRQPPVARHYYKRELAMMEDVDYVLSASTFVAKSFLERGFKPEQILPHPHVIDLSLYRPSEIRRPKDKPLTLISTSGCSLRKGTPYLLEACRQILKKIPGTKFVFRENIRDDVLPIVEKYRDLQIVWLPYQSREELAKELRNADILLLPSLEDGLGFVVVEALASGLPVIVTPNTGASDFVTPGVNGEIIPIRDAKAIVDAVEKWWEKIRGGDHGPVPFDRHVMTPENLETIFVAQLRALGVA